MSTPFKWPTQLKPLEAQDSLPEDARPRYVLVRKKADPKTKKLKTSSSSDGLIDIAAAVKLGLLPSAGLPGLLLHLKHRKILRLLEHNTVALVKPKRATTQRNHVTKATSKTAVKAMSSVLCPAYWQANKHAVTKATFKIKEVIGWIKANIENTDSTLCTSLRGTLYEDLIGTKRGRRWWLKKLNIRKSAE
jgi:prophage DNA circulation protein